MTIENVLIVDDEILMRKFLEETLERFGIDVWTAKDGFMALELLKEKEFDVIFTDIKMPQMSGIELLRRAKGEYPDTEVVVMTAYGTVETAVDAMKIGAFDYILKPFSVDQIEIMLKKISDKHNLINENKYLKQEINRKYNFNEIIGTSYPMRNVMGLISKIATSKATVLIQGESGTGKELVARAIHYGSDRSNKPFIKLNCAAMPESLLESELFGHEKGAFTGAHTKRLGRFELANGGTILLDEVSEIPLHLQAKLLRVVQEREFERVGGEKSIKVDVRIIATTNRDLIQSIKKGEFREDLYYRLNVVPVFLPPLRKRPDDIIELTTFFINKYCAENGMDGFALSDNSIEKMLKYSWPGNVRELENIVERSVVMGAQEIIMPGEMIDNINDDEESLLDQENIVSGDDFGFKIGTTVREMEKQLIFESLKANQWNKTKTAQMLDISIRTLRNKLNEYRDNNEIPQEFNVLLVNYS